MYFFFSLGENGVLDQKDFKMFLFQVWFLQETGFSCLQITKPKFLLFMTSLPRGISAVESTCVLIVDLVWMADVHRPPETQRHGEHMDNVRLYHRSLQDQEAGDAQPSSSPLFSALRYRVLLIGHLIIRKQTRKDKPRLAPGCH